MSRTSVDGLGTTHPASVFYVPDFGRRFNRSSQARTRRHRGAFEIPHTVDQRSEQGIPSRARLQHPAVVSSSLQIQAIGTGSK